MSFGLGDGREFQLVLCTLQKIANIEHQRTCRDLWTAFGTSIEKREP